MRGIQGVGVRAGAPAPNMGGAVVIVGALGVPEGIAMVTGCCCRQMSTFQGRGWVLSKTEVTVIRSEIERTATTKKWDVAIEFIDGKTMELSSSRGYFQRNRWWG